MLPSEANYIAFFIKLPWKQLRREKFVGCEDATFNPVLVTNSANDVEPYRNRVATGSLDTK